MRALEAGGGDAALAGVAGITWRDSAGEVHRNGRRPLGNVLDLPETDFDLLPRDFASRMEVFALSPSTQSETDSAARHEIHHDIRVCERSSHLNPLPARTL